MSKTSGVPPQNPVVKAKLPIQLTQILALALVVMLGACKEQPTQRPGGSDSGDSPADNPAETTRPGGSDPNAPIAIPATVAAQNPANREQDPSMPPLASLTSAKLEKRYADGLALERKDMCKELGQADCFGSVFKAALGGQQPSARAYGRRPTNPPTLAPVAIERIARTVCHLRRQKDSALGAKAEVFKFFDLGASQPSEEAVTKQTAFLYKKLLARQPSERELDIAKSILSHGLSGGEVAETLCFAVAGSMEILFN